MSVPTVEPKGAPVLRPPVTQTGVLGWLRANLFSTWYNAILTLLGLYILYSLIPPLIDWAFVRADWSGDTREACDRHERTGGRQCRHQNTDAAAPVHGSTVPHRPNDRGGRDRLLVVSSAPLASPPAPVPA